MTAIPEEDVRAAYAALSRGDVNGMLEMFSEDAELHELQELPDSAVYRGYGEIRHWADGVMALVDHWEWTPVEITEVDGRLLVKVSLTGEGKGSGAPIDQTVFHVFDLRDGRVVRIRGFLSEQRAREAAGAPIS